jgi:hypothetical protein
LNGKANGDEGDFGFITASCMSIAMSVPAAAIVRAAALHDIRFSTVVKQECQLSHKVPAASFFLRAANMLTYSAHINVVS